MQTSLPFPADGSAATASPAQAPPTRDGTGAGPGGGGAAATSSTSPPPASDPAAAAGDAGAGRAAPPRSDPARLSAELRAAVVRELARAWHFINGSHFRSALLPPTIGLHPGQSRLGMWQAATRTLSLAEDLVMSRPWGVVLEVLKHEMAHQYVHEILGPRGGARGVSKSGHDVDGSADCHETAHGPAFQAVCERLGIDATASGLPEPPPGAGDGAASAETKLLQRVARLLALAESSNVHEAEAAMQEAQRLLLKHNLGARAARDAHDARNARDGRHAREGGRARGYSFRHLGPVRARVDESARLVAMILGRHFFVEAIWVQSYDPLAARRGSVLEVCGSVENLELASYVHDFLHAAGERLWSEHKQRAGLRLDRDRRTYIAGVMLGFAERLAVQEKAQRTEGLVWCGDADLDVFFRRRHPHVRRVYQKGQPRTEARQEGQRAGRELVLHRPLRAPSSSGASAGPRALPPARR
ncbi:MAG: DUF2786 domain-containing protein [Polyangia bacterium]